MSKPKKGDLVTATVRRPGTSIYDVIGTNDMTSDDKYYERGICNRHGFLTEFFVEDEEFVVRVPDGIANLHCLMETSLRSKFIWTLPICNRQVKKRVGRFRSGWNSQCAIDFLDAPNER